MNKARLASLLLLALSCAAGAGSLAAQSETLDTAALLRKVDALVSFEDRDLAARYRIEKREPGGASQLTTATMFRRDRTDQYLILILEPAADKGKGYLRVGDNLWLYDPVGKSFTFTSAKDRFQNSGIRNSDFNRSNFSGDYRVSGSRREKLGKFDCQVLDLEALHERVSFPKCRIWVSEEGLVRKVEDYGLSGQLMRTTGIPSYQKVGERWLPQSMVLVDNLVSRKINGVVEYQRTTVTISEPSLAAQPDTLFTKEYLEKVSR